MEQSNRRWIIRDASGRIDGPFTTEKVLYKIGRGEFSGEEFISHYPGGKWIPISQDAQFYDKLLEALSGTGEEAGEETHVLEFTRQAASTQPSMASAQTRATELTPVLPPEDLERKARRRTKPQAEDIELVDARPKVLKAVAKRAFLPIAVVVGGLALAATLWVSSGPQEERIRLIAPQRGAEQLAPEGLKGRVSRGAVEFLKDTFDGYIRSQNEFVYVVEHNTRDGEVMALLCMTYLQLWPYAHQDSGDLKVISTLVQWSSVVDPGGVHSGTCRAVDFIVRARVQEAKSLVDAMLETKTNSPPIVFYFLKGYLLELTGDHVSALGYLQSAEQLWPQWSLPQMVRAQAETRLEHFSEAANIYRKVLQGNPGHSVARIELGLLEYKYFDHAPQAEQYLNQGLKGEQAPRAALSRGYCGLAEIALKGGNQSRALKYAQKAFSLNSSNVTAKNLIVQLGGVEKLKTTKVRGQQLLFEGDQFFREGDCHAAQAHYKAAFEQDQKNALAAMKAAQCLWKLSFSTEAIEWLNRAIRADPKLMEAYVTLADYQAQRYNFLAAARVLESAQKANPRSHEVYRGFALVELRRGNAAGALNFGKKAQQIYDNDVETQILMAQAAIALRDFRMAYNYAARATDIDMNNRKAQIVFAEAMAGQQGVDAGVDYLLKQVTNYPFVMEYRLALGKVFLADERFQQAEEVFRQIIKLEEKPKEAYVELAKVLKGQGNMGEALDLLLKAAVLDPADAEPLYLAGSIYLELKKPQEAIVQFQRVVTINKLFPLVHYQLGRAALLMEDPREAVAQAEEEKKVNPQLADSYILAAEAHAKMKQFPVCASEYQKAIKLRPQQAFIYVKLAQCYHLSGSLDAAISMLNAAASKESGLADIYKEQGAIYEMKGDSNRAIEAYNQYFLLDPDAPDRGDIERRISTLQSGRK